jgi:hypothetical protein
MWVSGCIAYQKVGQTAENDVIVAAAWYFHFPFKYFRLINLFGYIYTSYLCMTFNWTDVY